METVYTFLKHIAADFSKHISDSSVFKYFDGMVLSVVEKAAKPKQSNLKYLYRPIYLDKSDCVFIETLKKTYQLPKSSVHTVTCLTGTQKTRIIPEVIGFHTNNKDADFSSASYFSTNFSL